MLARLFGSRLDSVQYFVWYFLGGVLFLHIAALFLVKLEAQDPIYVIGIICGFLTVGLVGKIRVWITSTIAALIFGSLPNVNAANTTRDINLLVWKGIMHTALGATLSFFVIAAIPFEGDVVAAVIVDSAMILLTLLSLAYIERAPIWYPNIVRIIAGSLVFIALLRIAKRNASVQSWLMSLGGLLGEHKEWILGIVIVLGTLFALKKLLNGVTISKWITTPIILLLLLLGLGIAYKNKKSLHEETINLGAYLNNSLTREIPSDSLKEFGWTDIPSGRYTIQARGLEYRYRCPGEKGDRSGYPEGHRADGGIIVGKTGGVRLAKGKDPESFPTNGDQILIAPNEEVRAWFDTECPGQEILTQGTGKIKITFTPIENK